MGISSRTDTIEIHRADLAEQVYQVLRLRIFNAALRSGDKIRPDDIAKELGVSRTPVVEAINRLAEQGLVMLQPHRSARVSILSLERVIALFEVRLMMEEFAARSGLRRVTDQDVSGLNALLGGERGLIDGATVTDYLAWLRLNREFHQACIDLASNPLLSELHARLNLDIVLARAFRLATLRNSRQVHHEHLEILRAYERRDEGLLVDAVRAHLTRGRDAYATFAAAHDET